MGNSSSAVPDVVEQIKASGAKSLRAEFAGGNVQDIAVPNVRQKWKRLRALLRNLGDDWLRIEGFDAKGALLVVIDNPDASPLEDISDFGPDTTAGKLDPLLSLMLKAQDVALSRSERMTKNLLDSHAKLLELVSRRLVASERALAEQLQRNTEYAEMVQELIIAASREGDGDSELDGLIVKLLPRMLAGRKGGEAKPKEPNGESS